MQEHCSHANLPIALIDLPSRQTDVVLSASHVTAAASTTCTNRARTCCCLGTSTAMADRVEALSKDAGPAGPPLGRTSVCSSVHSDTYTHEQHHRGLAQMKARRSVEMPNGATDSAPGSTCGTLPHHAVLSHRAEELIELVSGLCGVNKAFTCQAACLPFREATVISSKAVLYAGLSIVLLCSRL
jgi:hypothetical protein